MLLYYYYIYIIYIIFIKLFAKKENEIVVCRYRHCFLFISVFHPMFEFKLLITRNKRAQRYFCTSTFYVFVLIYDNLKILAFKKYIRKKYILLLLMIR